MFDIQEPGCVPGNAIPVPDTPAVMPLERLEAQICHEQRDQANDPELFRPSKWVIEPADWIRYIREHTAA